MGDTQHTPSRSRLDIFSVDYCGWNNWDLNMYIHVHPLAFCFLVSQYMIVKTVIIIVRLLDSDFCHTKHDLARLYGMSCLGVELVELNCWDSILIRDIAKVVFTRLEQSSPLELVFPIEYLNPKFQVKQSPYATQNTCYRGQTQELTNLQELAMPFNMFPLVLPVGFG